MQERSEACGSRNRPYSRHLLRMTSLEVGVSMSGQRHSCPVSECVSRERVEKGYPTSSLPPTRAATDNTLLSGMGGDNGPKEEPWGAGQERDEQRALFTTSTTSSSALSPRAPKNWAAQGTCVQGLALPTALLYVSGTSLNHLFPCLLEATVVSFYCYQ